MNKKYKAKLNNDKAYSYKLLNNKKFISDFEEFNKRADEEIAQIDSKYETKKSFADFDKLIEQYNIPAKYEYVIDYLLPRAKGQFD